MSLEELLRIDSQDTFNFFCSSLKNEVEDKPVTEEETLHVASILASYANTSRHDAGSMPPFENLVDVFDNFVLRQDALQDRELLEMAAAQSLFLAGFYREGMKRRHNVAWYDRLGRGFYIKAGRLSNVARRRTLFHHMAHNFPLWTEACQSLEKNLRESRFVLRLE